MFHEIKNKSKGPGWEKVGESLVAKESRFIEGEESKEKFHTVFCHVQHRVKETPMLRPSEDEVSLPPPITFLKSSIYEYTNWDGVRCGLLGKVSVDCTDFPHRTYF
jgi:hypothetical protein